MGEGRDGCVPQCSTWGDDKPQEKISLFVLLSPGSSLNSDSAIQRRVSYGILKVRENSPPGVNLSQWWLTYPYVGHGLEMVLNSGDTVLGCSHSKNKWRCEQISQYLFFFLYFPHLNVL